MPIRPRLALCFALVACSPDKEVSTDTGTGTSEPTGTTSGSESGTVTPTGSSETGSESGSESGTAEPTTGEPVLCEGAGESNLPGVSIVFPPQPCTFTLAEAAAGLEFDYVVEIADALAGVTRDANITCAEPDPSGLIVTFSIAGGDQGYCLCDSGLCPGPDPAPVSLQPGSFPDSATWEGVNWSGPSDTGNPYGPPFPPGDYTLSVVSVGTFGGADYQVLGTFPITLTP